MPHNVIHATRSAALAAALLLAASCGDNASAPDLDIADIDVAFVPASVDLGQARQTTISLENHGDRAVAPLQLVPGSVSRGGGPETSVRLQAVPNEIATLAPGSSRDVTVSLVASSTPGAGDYEASLTARWQGEVVSSAAITFTVAPPPPGGQGRTAAITGGPGSPRQGDVVTYMAETRDSSGALVSDPSLAWTVSPATAGNITGDGRFVGYAPGPAMIIATITGSADTLGITIVARDLSGEFNVVGHGEVTSRFTSDLWVHGDYAYTGTWSCRAGVCGDRLQVWRISDPSSPTLTDAVVLDARVVNDVKVRADGTLGVITHESSNDAQNGITLLDLSNPAQPAVITRFTDGLESGVHNVWVEGDYVYVVVDGAGNGLRIIDISNPSTPRVVASYYAGSSFLHDVYVRNGLAFLSHWNAGLVILDVGNGMAGGSPASPREVGRLKTAGGQTHNAWYWPETGYVFVGEEDFNTPGIMHVVDARDLSNPIEVATFTVPGTATPHNFWLDEDRAILYAAWYESGIRAIDVSGVLMGALDRQGREIASIQYNSTGSCGSGLATCSWAPQLHNGLIFASDLNSGLWILEPDL